MQFVSTVGRALYSLVLAVFGVLHFLKSPDMAGVVPAWLPGSPVMYVYVSGVLLIVGGLSFLSRKWVHIFGYVTSLLLLSFVLFVHLPGVLDAATMQSSIPNLLKDAALLGAALMLTAHEE